MTDGRDGHIFLLNQLFFFDMPPKKNKQTKNVAISLYIEKFTRVSTLQCDALRHYFVHAWPKKRTDELMRKIDFYFLIKYKNSRICKNKNVLFDWLIYNRQPPRNPRFCVAKNLLPVLANGSRKVSS